MLAASAAALVVLCTAFLLYNPSGLLRVAAALLIGSLVLAVATGTHFERRAAASSTEESGPTPSLRPPAPTSSLPPRQTSDDYWYPAAATRDRNGTQLRGPGL
jgi:hypothetical protein